MMEKPALPQCCSIGVYMMTGGEWFIPRAVGFPRSGFFYEAESKRCLGDSRGE